ncbi:MAG: Rnf-Nqr domain containing protein, partial [Pseudomonadota bacterium]
LCRRALLREVRIPIYVLLIAALVTASELFFHAYLPDLHARLGIFLPLIVTNCTIVARAEAFASREPPLAALVDGLAHGIGFGLTLLAVGSLRELAGTGRLFADLGLLLPGAPMAGFGLDNSGLLLALLPPGAFFALAGLLVIKNLTEK